MKRCPDCGETKSASDFSPSRRTKDGLRIYCRNCSAARKRRRRGQGLEKPHRKTPEERRASRRKRWGEPTVTACEICGRSDKPLVPDHDHKTNQLRGWLCSTCNSGLGFFYDDPDYLTRAINYLMMHRTRS